MISRGPLSSLVPIENAAMQDRTVIQWDKDDLDILGMIKVDVLALGMLTCIRKAFHMIAAQYGRTYTLATLPQDDPAVYEMLCRADSVGVFQVESRAQMSMLPRLRPRNYYDLVIEVAIVRPGPIQGDMVHPYLRRRDGKEQVDYPSQALRKVLERPSACRCFRNRRCRSPSSAPVSRPPRPTASGAPWRPSKKTGDIHQYRDKLIEGMVARGYERGFAERCYSQIEGFGNYGFRNPMPPASPCWSMSRPGSSITTRRFSPRPLLNSQPMGFYQPAQLVRDAVDHGVEMRPVDVNFSAWDNGLEEVDDPRAQSRALCLCVSVFAR